MITPEQIAKLPKGIQTEVNTLIMRLNEANNEIKRLKENTPSNTIAGHGFDLTSGSDQFLKNNQTVTFKFDGGDVRARIDGDMLHINASTLHTYYLAVLPHASNVIHVKLTKY